MSRGAAQDAPYDAVVIGGGPAGAAAALLLARAGWSVAVVEKAAFPRRKVCGEFISATNRPLLRDLGIEDEFLALAGPEVRRVGLFAKHDMLTAPMPRRLGFGRALGRDRLDSLLVAAAARAGADISQPWRADAIVAEDGLLRCAITGDDGRRDLVARHVIAACGSWERGPSPLAAPRPHRACDLLAFKAHFRNAELAPDLMPLLAFPGGYGGMVHADGGRTTLSCCIRRDALQACRARQSEAPAAQAVLAHIMASCRGARQALGRADLDGIWLAAGPIRPGRRPVYADRLFRIGNLAGEAHPAIAEGISMALQSSWLLTRRLIAAGPAADAAAVAAAYRADWDAQFALRRHAAALFAHLAMRPAAIGPLLPMLRLWPGAITLGAQLSGKSRPLAAVA